MINSFLRGNKDFKLLVFKFKLSGAYVLQEDYLE